MSPRQHARRGYVESRPGPAAGCAAGDWAGILKGATLLRQPTPPQKAPAGAGDTRVLRHLCFSSKPSSWSRSAVSILVF